MRHATCGASFRARAFATLALITVGLGAAMAGVVEILTR